MRNILLFNFLLIGSMLTFNGCKKDDPDPCKNIICLNGGTCASGACNCPTGYKGGDCGTVKIPTSIIVSSIDVTRFPATDGGAGWDLTSGADLQVKIRELISGNVIYTSGIYTDANPSLDYTFTNGLPIALDATTRYQIDVYDDDLTIDDWMGGIIFYAFTVTDGPITTLTLDVSSEVAFTMSLSYTY